VGSGSGLGIRAAIIPLRGEESCSQAVEAKRVKCISVAHERAETYENKEDEGSRRFGGWAQIAQGWGTVQESTANHAVYYHRITIVSIPQ